MMTADTAQLIKEYLTPAQSILVLFSSQANFDQISAATALAAGLQKLGKNVTLACPSELNENMQPVLQRDLIAQTFGNKNLQVSFDYVPETVERVSYDIDEQAQKFYLIVQPKKGSAPLDISTVKYEYTGVEADLFFLVGVSDLESLDELYLKYSDLYESTPLVSVNSFDTSFGTIKVNTAGEASFCESILGLLQSAGVEVSDDIATNLLAGIERATDGFRSLTTTAETFEAVSKLLRSGARRFVRTPSVVTASPFAQALGQRVVQPVIKNGDLELPGGRVLVKNGKEKKKKTEVMQPDFKQMEGRSLV